MTLYQLGHTHSIFQRIISNLLFFLKHLFKSKYWFLLRAHNSVPALLHQSLLLALLTSASSTLPTNAQNEHCLLYRVHGSMCHSVTRIRRPPSLRQWMLPCQDHSTFRVPWQWHACSQLFSPPLHVQWHAYRTRMGLHSHGRHPRHSSSRPEARPALRREVLLLQERRFPRLPR